MGNHFVMELPKQPTSVGFTGLPWGKRSRVDDNWGSFGLRAMESKKLGSAGDPLGNYCLLPGSLAG